MNEELGTNVELEDSGCVQDVTETLSLSDELVQRINILDLSDDVLLNILKYCQPRDLKALGFTCPRFAYLICDHTLWSHVDARSYPCGEDRLQWYIGLLNPGTKHLLLNGFAREAKIQDEARRERAKNPEPPSPQDPRANAAKRSHDGELKTIDASNYGNGSDAATQPENHTESPMSPNPSSPVRLPGTYCMRRTSLTHQPRVASPLPLPSDGTATMTITRGILTRLIEQCPNLTWLALDYCNIDCHKTKLSMFPPTLRKLSLVGSRCYNMPTNKSFLYRIHEYIPQLQELDVSLCNWLAPSCLLPLSRLVNLDVLRARSCNMLSEFVAYASLATRYGFAKLRVLDIRNSPVADSEVSSLGWLPCLEELYLSALDEDISASYEPQEALIDEWELYEPEYFKQRASEPPSTTESPTASDTEIPAQRTNRGVSYEIFDTLDQGRCNVSVFTITVNHNRPQPRLDSVLALLGETERARARANERMARRRANQRPLLYSREYRELEIARMRARIAANRKRDQEMEQQKRENDRNDEEEMVENLRKMRENVERMAQNLERMNQIVDGDRINDRNDDDDVIHENDSNDCTCSQNDSCSASNSDTSSNKDDGVDSKMIFSEDEDDINSEVVDAAEIANVMNKSKDDETEKDEDIKKQNDRKRPDNDFKEQVAFKKRKTGDDDDDRKTQLVVNMASFIQNNVAQCDLNIKYRLDSNRNQSTNESNTSTVSNELNPKTSQPSTSHNESSTSHSEPSTSQYEPSTSQNEPSASCSKPSFSRNELYASYCEPSSSNCGTSTSKSGVSASICEPSISHNEPSTSHNEPSTSHNKSSTSHNKSSTSHNKPSTSHNKPSTSHNKPSTSHNKPSTSHNEPSTSHNEPSTSHHEPSSSHNEPSTSHNEPSTSKQNDNNRPVKYVKFRKNRPPVILEQAEEPNRPSFERRPQDGDVNRMVHEENIFQDEFPFICVDLGRNTPRTYQVTVSNERITNNAPGPNPSRMLNMIRNIFYAAPPVMSQSSLVTDVAIRHFGRENDQDIIHIGPNGALIRGRPDDNRSRPKKSRLRKLVCTGYNGITNSSLTHLAVAAPELVLIDFSGTRVNEVGVNSFKLTRPDCEVVYDKKKKGGKDKNDK